jgi:hypothetical protein
LYDTLDFQGGDLIEQAKLGGTHTICVVAVGLGLTILLLRARQAFVPFSKSGYKRQNAPLFTGVRELVFSETWLPVRGIPGNWASG